MGSAEVRFKELRADFGKTAEDYGRHRAGFPDEFFERLASMGIVRAGMRALDLGTGTGTIARGLALRGCEVTALDRSEPLMEQARELDREAGVVVNYVVAAAEETGLPAASFDVVTAGQCWHWFDRPRAAAEARRLLKPGGRLVIGHFDWIPIPGNMVDATEKLIEKHNPKWKLGGGVGIYPQWMAGLAQAGFKNLETFSFDIDAIYTHEAWRGRIRASAGVGASLTPEAVAAFDDELRAMLNDRFAEDPMRVPHRVFAAIGTAP
ncbi:MAG: methyltransferase domain-containing protein [Candidatus Binatus sp.]|uniref:class I SAM-dependent methyltransferase n=1 Tax=Candidatus Binatus sp. TaxID=2811406 RepID=UPI0027283DA3|nr:class I SAM-dependent methyltransferase [Candidatus Binatus sp.]MDO8433461.1 methyltransferase domain-containing protein [Candidatus Binatus sp.]